MRRDEGLEMELQRELDVWLADAYVPASPRNLDVVVERTRTMRQRPAWASLERWLPMAVITARPELVAPLRAVWLLLITLLVLALVTGGLLIGAHLMRATAVIPQDGEALIAFGTLDDGPDGQKAGDIYTVQADGTDLRQLTSGPEWDANPSWSPDGTRIAFRSWVDGTDSVVVMDADGENRMILASSEQSSQDCLKGANLAWSPDGETLVFPTRNPCDGPFDLQYVSTDGTTTAKELRTDGFEGRVAAWSPTGDALAVIGQGDEPGSAVGLYIIDGDGWRLDGAQARDGLRRVGPDLGSINEIPVPLSWSPDATKLVVGSRPTPGIAESIHVVQADGSGRPLTIENAWSPVWSPDGGRIAFQRPVDPAERFDDRPCTVRTWLVDADGTNERMLDELGDGCDFGPAWSPDGTRLLGLWIDTDPANADEFPFYLSVVTVDGSEPPVHLLDTGGAAWQPVAPPSD
jgi:TolB protein